MINELAITRWLWWLAGAASTFGLTTALVVESRRGDGRSPIRAWDIAFSVFVALSVFAVARVADVAVTSAAVLGVIGCTIYAMTAISAEYVGALWFQWARRRRCALYELSESHWLAYRLGAGDVKVVPTDVRAVYCDEPGIVLMRASSLLQRKKGRRVPRGVRATVVKEQAPREHNGRRIAPIDTLRVSRIDAIGESRSYTMPVRRGRAEDLRLALKDALDRGILIPNATGCVLVMSTAA